MNEELQQLNSIAEHAPSVLHNTLTVQERQRLRDIAEHKARVQTMRKNLISAEDKRLILEFLSEDGDNGHFRAISYVFHHVLGSKGMKEAKEIVDIIRAEK